MDKEEQVFDFMAAAEDTGKLLNEIASCSDCASSLSRKAGSRRITLSHGELMGT